jgi:hypothetical protein
MSHLSSSAPLLTTDYFLSISQQGVSADIIQNSKIQLLETSPQKQKERRQKQLCADKLVTTQI